MSFGNSRKGLEGGYIPSFYHSELNENDLKDAKGKPDFYPVVFHEYIHFLQDVFTTFGLARSTTTYNNIRYIYNLPPGTKIELPIEFDKVLGENHCSTANNRLFKLYENFCEKEVKPINVNEFDEIEIIENQAFVSTEKECLGVEQYTIKLLKDSEVKYEFPFGASCIYECMASIFEHYLYPDDSKAVWPFYDLPKIYLKQKLGDRYSDKVAFCICYFSLMNYNSAELFLMAVDKILEYGIEVKSISSLDSYIKADDGRALSEVFESVRNEARDALVDIFNADVPGMSVARDWALRWYDKRFDGYHFFDNLVSLFDLGRDMAKRIFCFILKGWISPIITNRNGKQVAILESVCGYDEHYFDNLSYWIYFENMYRFVFTMPENGPLKDTGVTGCYNCDICDSQNNDEDACLDFPLSKRLAVKPFCMLRQLWQMWGLYKFEVVKGDDRIGPLKQNLC